MKKKKYSKPVAAGMNTIASAVGSCVSGNPEYTMINCSTTGDIALTTCTPGNIVYPALICVPTGSEAGYSCVDGWGAG